MMLSSSILTLKESLLSNKEIDSKCECLFMIIESTAETTRLFKIRSIKSDLERFFKDLSFSK